MKLILIKLALIMSIWLGCVSNFLDRCIVVIKRSGTGNVRDYSDLAFARGCTRVEFGLSHRFFISHKSTLCHSFRVIFFANKKLYVLFLSHMYILNRVGG